MKLQNQNIKSNFLKKIFIKICRKLDFEIIDQNFKQTQFKPLWSVLARLERVSA